MSGGGPPPPMRMSGGGMQPQMRMSNGGMQPQMRMSGGGMQPAPHGGGYPGSSGSPCGGQSQEAESPTYRQPSSPGECPGYDCLLHGVGAWLQQASIQARADGSMLQCFGSWASSYGRAELSCCSTVCDTWEAGHAAVGPDTSMA